MYARGTFVLMKQRYFEDLKIGDRFQSDTYLVTQVEIVAFAGEFDPQVFHLDPASAKKTIFEGLIASGWHTAAVSMRLFLKSMNVTGGIIGLVVDELRWPNSLMTSDVLVDTTEIIKR